MRNKLFILIILFVSLSTTSLFAKVMVEAGGSYSFMQACDNLSADASLLFGSDPLIEFKEIADEQGKFNQVFSENSERLYKYYTKNASNTVKNFGISLHLGFSLFTIPIGSTGYGNEKLNFGFGALYRIHFNQEDALSLTFDMFDRSSRDLVICLGAAYTRTILERHILSAGLIAGVDVQTAVQSGQSEVVLPGIGVSLSYRYRIL